MKNRLKVIVALASIMLLFSSNAFALFDSKYKETLKKLEEEMASHAELNKKYESAVRENEALKQDRDNLIIRAKSMMIDKGKFSEFEGIVARLESEKRAAEEELNKVTAERAALRNEIGGLEENQAVITKENSRLKSAEEKSGKDELIKKLQADLVDYREVFNKIGSGLKNAERDIEQLEMKNHGLEVENEKLSGELKEYKKNYADAVKKNNGFEQAVKNMPKKFSEIARQNKMLIKETSQMHYNMGVFYTKNKEYSRAATEFEKAVEINPDDVSGHFNLGYIYAEYMVNRKKAVEQFRHYLRLAKKGDKDIEWAKKYILTWDTWEGKEPMQ